MLKEKEAILFGGVDDLAGMADEGKKVGKKITFFKVAERASRKSKGGGISDEFGRLNPPKFDFIPT